ncbi:TPA_asm: coat protein [ssRNA phage SRR6960802_4]|uniref:Coat protein n=1 Tax=ssRNA phage SRR6960802_4 TaxID=2786610 RepID=A0A8S5L0U0_9VIRU|nr:coat protein [ssRNA phage SRR6960802_4]DAD51055.1 TPA_asm: coat protein [ssRNA phage SRR6960802_4]
MALADPQTLTFDAGAISLPRISVTPSSSVYRIPNGLVTLTVTQNRSKRNRTTIRIDGSKTVSDPLLPAVNKVVSMSTYVVVDRPLVGFSQEDLLDSLNGLVGWIQASSGANAEKVLGGES